jgi:hypothetical protein
LYMITAAPVSSRIEKACIKRNGNTNIFRFEFL